MDVRLNPDPEVEGGICIEIDTKCDVGIGGVIYWDYDGDRTNVTAYSLDKSEYHMNFPEVGVYKVRVEVWDFCKTIIGRDENGVPYVELSNDGCSSFMEPEDVTTMFNKIFID